MKKIKLLLSGLILVLISVSACSSNDSEKTNDNNPKSKLILGKWAWTTQATINECSSYREFKSNGTLTYHQNVCDSHEIDNLKYELVGNKIKIGTDEDDTETIIELTDKTMSITFNDYNGVQNRTYIKIP